MKKTINCGGKLLNIETPIVMGILNITPDSFFDGGSYKTDAEILNKIKQMLDEGASIIDIGAQSSKPKAILLTPQDELQRLLPAVKMIRKEYPDMPLSVDTFHAEVAVEAINEGANIINDISGGTMDDKMFETIARYQVPYILTHIKGSPSNMQDNPIYDNVITEVMDYFIERIDTLRRLGVNDIIIDPGFGFGKNVDHNFILLKHLSLLKMLECLILCGLSRKSLINKIIKTTPLLGLNGTTVVNTIALLNGATILRVHDVKEAIEAIKLVQYLQNI